MLSCTPFGNRVKFYPFSYVLQSIDMNSSIDLFDSVDQVLRSLIQRCIHNAFDAVLEAGETVRRVAELKGSFQTVKDQTK